MLETIKSLILDFRDSRWETGVPRRLRVQPVKGKATVCMGVRRSGKSTFMLQLMERLVASGVSRENILCLNFFDDRLHGLGPGSLDLITEAYFSLYPEKKGAEKIYCFFDEIQDVPGWERFVDRIMRTEKCGVYITGSSASMLSKEIATQMRGRALSWELFPFSFKEFLDFKEIDWKGALSTRRRMLVQKAFGEYWEAGGFPEVAGLGRSLRIKTHQEYFGAILYRDLIERHDIAHPRAIADLAHRLIGQTASMCSINSLTGYLKSLGHKVPKQSVSEYLRWFEDAYFLFTIQLFDASVARRKTNPDKVYCVDHSLVTSVSSSILVNSGHLLENLVFASLRRLHTEIYYYRTRTGKEVDFIVPAEPNAKLGEPGRGKDWHLVQVCESLANPQTRKRELAALGEAMEEMGASETTIVTRAEGELIDVRQGRISAVPIWKFLLDLPDVAE